MAVLGGLNSQYERLSVLHLSDDGLAVEDEDQFFASFNRRIRDICVNPETGAVYVAFNGTSYPGSGPNMIKEFRNMAFVSSNVSDVAATQNLTIFPNPVNANATLTFTESLIGNTFAVFAFNGQKVAEEKITSTQQTLDCSAFAAGSYFIKASSDKGTITKTFVVSR